MDVHVHVMMLVTGSVVPCTYTVGGQVVITIEARYPPLPHTPHCS